MNLRYSVLLLVAVLVISDANAQSNWPRFRGAGGAGLADDAAIPSTWSVDDYDWVVSLPGRGHASPIVWDGRIYCWCADPNTARRILICLSQADGTERWRREFSSKTYRQHSANGFATATPVADDQGVVVTWTTPDCVRLVAIDHRGVTMWERDFGSFVGPHGSGASPVIGGDVVVMTNMQEDTQLLGRLIGRENPDGPIGSSAVVAVDRMTGRDRWSVERQTTLAAYSTPCIRRGPQGKHELVCTSTSHGISAFDLATGKLLWEVPDLFEDRCVGSPLSVGELVLASYGHGTRGSLLAAVRNVDGEPEVAYQVKKSVPLVPTPIAVEGHVFLWSDSGVVTCLAVRNGEQQWQERVGGNYFGSPVAVGQRIFCIDKKGTVAVIAASSEFKLLGKTPLGEPSFATPAISNGVIYLRSATKLYSLGGGSGR